MTGSRVATSAILVQTFELNGNSLLSPFPPWGGEERGRPHGEKAFTVSILPGVDRPVGPKVPVTVKMGDLGDHMAGQATGLVGTTPISVTVRFAYVSKWVVYAHELGWSWDSRGGDRAGSDPSTPTTMRSMANSFQCLSLFRFRRRPGQARRRRSS